jgi:hypothetical protein
MWTVRCRTVLQTLAGALQESPMNERKVVMLLIVLWLLPQEVFTVPGRSRGGRQGRKNRHHRIHHVLNDAALLGRLAERVERAAHGDGPDQVRAASADGVCREGRASCDPLAFVGDAMEQSGGLRSEDDASAAGTAAAGFVEECVQPTDSRVAQRVGHLFRLGHCQRAMRALVSTSGVADLDQDEERTTLKGLHPGCPSALPPCPSDAPELVVDPGWMASEMQHSDTGAAAGASGWGSNFASVLASDVPCVTAMAVLIDHIVNNTLPETVQELLNTCLLVSLVKPGGGEGRRPVAMGDMFYRMASRFALSLVMEPAQRALRPHQFGVGVEDGCTQVVQSLQHLLNLPPAPAPAGPRPVHQFAFSIPRPVPEPADPTPRPLACLSIDVANAFNTVDRAAVLRAVYGHPELAQCWRMVAFGYGRPSWLLMPCGDRVVDNDAFVQSTNGVRQGDPLAALLFALAVHVVYKRVAEICRQGCFAYSDDSHGVGWLEECWRAWEELPALLEPLGLRLNVQKCEVTCFYTGGLLHVRDVDALERFRAKGVTINTRTLKVLGCVVGISDAAVAHELCVRPFFRADQRAAFRRLPLLDKQTRHLALTQLTGTVLTNRLRAMSPAATEVHAAEYDREVLQAAHSLVGIRAVDGDRYDEQLQWPARLGGFGLLSAVRIAPAAYLAGAECTLRSSPVFSEEWGKQDGRLEAAWPITVAVEDGLRRVAAVEAEYIARCTPEAVAGVSPSVLPNRAAEFIQHFKANPPGPIQSAIIHRIVSLSHIARMAAAGEGGVQAVAEVARLQSLREKESSRWLRVLPTDSRLRLTDLQWQTAAQMRLGVPKAPHGAIGVSCTHGKAAADDGWHALVCQQRSGAAVTRRHNAVVHLLADAAELIKVPARIEPYQLCDDDQHRPDIQLDLPEYTLLGDVTISHPNAARWRAKVAARGVEAVGDARAAEKDATYAPMAVALEAVFAPFVLYTHGGFHKSALSFIDALGAGYDPAVALVSLSAWKDELKDRIAVCVQRHTANIVIDDARRARVDGLPGRRRGARRSWARRWPSALVASSRRRYVAAGGSDEVGGRAASLCAVLFSSPSSSSAPDEVSSPMSVGSEVVTEVMSVSPVSSESFVPATVMTASVDAVSFVPGTPGMDETSPDVSGACGELMLELSRNSCISRASVSVLVEGMADVPAASAAALVGAGACA